MTLFQLHGLYSRTVTSEEVLVIFTAVHVHYNVRSCTQKALDTTASGYKQ